MNYIGALKLPKLDGRWLVAACLLTYFAVLAFFQVGMGVDYKQVWRQLGPPAKYPPFSDLRGLTGGELSTLDGLDPIIYNPYSPENMVAEYPHVWYKVMIAFHMQSLDPNKLGIFLVLTFYISVLLFMGKVTVPEGFFWGFLLCTPAPMLGIERGNCELLIFALLALALLVRRRSNSFALIGSYALIEACAWLKFFPISAFFLAFREKSRMAITVLLVGCLSFIGYVYRIRNQVKEILHTIPQRTDWSFGRKVFVDYWFPISSRHDSLRIPISTMLAVTVFLALAAIGRLWAPRIPVMPRPKLEAMIVGSVIYVSTFILISNFNYRMIYLFFTLPALFHIRNKKGIYCNLSTGLLICVTIGWLFCGSQNAFLFTIKELANWSVFAGMAFFLFQCMPIPWTRVNEANKLLVTE